MKLWRLTRAPFVALDGKGARAQWRALCAAGHAGGRAWPARPALAVLIALRYQPRRPGRDSRRLRARLDRGRCRARARARRRDEARSAPSSATGWPASLSLLAAVRLAGAARGRRGTLQPARIPLPQRSGRSPPARSASPNASTARRCSTLSGAPNDHRSPLRHAPAPARSRSARLGRAALVRPVGRRTASRSRPRPRSAGSISIDKTPWPKRSGGRASPSGSIRSMPGSRLCRSICCGTRSDADQRRGDQRGHHRRICRDGDADRCQGLPRGGRARRTGTSGCATAPASANCSAARRCCWAMARSAS